MSLSERSGVAKQLPAGRRADLAAFVATSGQMTVASLAERYGVSIDTIRRDLDQLDADGVLVRTHGGAVSNTVVARIDRDVDVRLKLQAAEKDAIAELTAGLVNDGSVLMLNGGTTTLAVARHLADHRDLTVATNNLRIAEVLSPDAYRDLYVFGGSVRSVTQATTGPVTFQSAMGVEINLRCDLAIVAVGAVADDGYSTSNIGDAGMMSEMMQKASRVAVLADSSKFDRRLFAQIANLDRADYFVSDVRPPEALYTALREANVDVVYPGSQSS
jgi:DeoR/GlpR family transcriptional regulator of sugar metabolism